MKKRIISLALCMALIITAMFTGTMNAIVSADTGVASAKVLAEELAGYKRIVPSDLQNSNGIRSIGNDGDNDNSVLTLQNGGVYYAPGGFAGKTYLDFDINFHNSTNTVSLLSKTNEAYRSNLFIRFLENDNFRLDSYGDDQKVSNLLWTKAGISRNEYFNVKLLTNVTMDSATAESENIYYQLWVNDSYIGEGNITVAAHEGCIAAKGANENIMLRDPIDPIEFDKEFEGYKRVSLNDFVYANGGSVSIPSTDAGFAGYRISRAAYKSNTAEASDSYSLDKTYLDFDLKTSATTGQLMSLYNRENWHDYIRVNWYNDSSVCFSYVYLNGEGGDTVDAATQKTVQLASFGAAAGEYFNLKIRTDFTPNENNPAKRDAVIQFWINDRFAHEMKLTATDLRNGLFCSGNSGDSFYVKEPLNKDIDRELEGYDRVDMFDYLCNGARVIDPATGIMGFVATDDARALFTDFDKKYLDIDADFIGATNSFIQYMAPSKSRSCFRFDFTSEANFRFAYYDEAQNLHTLANINIGDFGASWNEYFNIKLRTDIESVNDTSDKVKVQLWINNKFAFDGVADIVYQSVKEKRYFYVGNGTKVKTSIDEATNLESYKKVVLDDIQNLGAPRNENGTVYSGGIAGEYLYGDLFGTYLDVDLKVPTALNPFMTIPSKNVDNTGFWGDNEQVRLLLEGTTLKLTTVHAGKGVYTLNLGDISAAPYNYSADEFFNLKVRTKVYDTGIIGYLVYVNDSLLNCAYVGANTDNTNKFLPLYDSSTLAQMTCVGLRGTDGADIYARTPVYNETLGGAVYDLNKGGYLLTGADTFDVNGVMMNSGDVLNTPGDYVIKRIIGGKTASTQLVTLYKLGDVNLDGQAFVAGDAIWKDLYSLDAIVRYGTVVKAAEKAADLNNDGKVTADDYNLLTAVKNDSSKLEELIGSNFGDNLSYEYLGGKNVMPIAGFYGPDTTAKTSDETYQLIKESGINIINLLPFSYGGSNNRDVFRNLALAEKYGIGIYVTDSNLNKLTVDGSNNVTSHTYLSTAADLANAMKEYSTYGSFLGIHVFDEPEYDNDAAYSENYKGKYKYYQGILSALKPFTNVTGFINLHGAGALPKGSYESYLEAIVNDVDVLSFDAYPYFYTDAAAGNHYKLNGYLESLDSMRAVSVANSKPFWAFAQVGTDFRDNGADGATTAYHTEADTLWNVNVALAFGAKGIEYFPMMQPEYFSNDSTKQSGHDYDRNGIIGANGETTRYYDMVKRANTQIAAIDGVLMNADSLGVIATGTAANDISGAASQRNHTFESIISKANGQYTNKLVNVETDKADGAMVGCFGYKNSEAYYVVNYSRTENDSQVVTLDFDTNYDVKLIKDGIEYSLGESGQIKIALGSGEGVLVVLGDSSDMVIDSASSSYTLKTDATVNGVAYPAGTVFTENGEYAITRTVSGITSATVVVIYKTGDINKDNTVNILDIVELKKYYANVKTLTKSAKLAEKMLSGNGSAEKLASLINMLLSA